MTTAATAPPPAAVPDPAQRVAGALSPAVAAARPPAGQWVERSATSPLVTRYVTP